MGGVRDRFMTTTAAEAVDENSYGGNNQGSTAMLVGMKAAVVTANNY